MSAVSRRVLSAVFVASALAAAGTASGADFPESEPNELRTNATVVGPMSPGDAITGTTTGTVPTPAGSPQSIDMFRITTIGTDPGIYRYRLVITSNITGHVGRIRGFNQTGTSAAGGSLGSTDTTVQSTVSTTNPPRFNQWYGFGKAEQLYWHIVGNGGATTAPYRATLERTTIQPIVLAGPLYEGDVTIGPGSGSVVDRDFWVYDNNLDPVPCFGRDGGATPQQTKTQHLNPGTYFLAVGTNNVANNQLSCPGETLFNPVLDYPHILVADANTSSSTPLNTVISSSGGGLISAAATRTEHYQIIFFRFEVLPLVTGACCTNGSCTDTTQDACPGVWNTGTACVSFTCPQPSTVCCRGSTCSIDTPVNCTVASGSQAGAFTIVANDCNAPGNNTGPCCKADYNKVSNVELLDIFAFLNDWFGNRPYADFNGQSNVDLLDIFAFLNAWFAGPC